MKALLIISLSAVAAVLAVACGSDMPDAEMPMATEMPAPAEMSMLMEMPEMVETPAEEVEQNAETPATMEVSAEEAEPNTETPTTVEAPAEEMEQDMVLGVGGTVPGRDFRVTLRSAEITPEYSYTDTDGEAQTLSASPGSKLLVARLESDGDADVGEYFFTEDVSVELFGADAVTPKEIFSSWMEVHREFVRALGADGTVYDDPQILDDDFVLRSGFAGMLVGFTVAFEVLEDAEGFQIRYDRKFGGEVGYDSEPDFAVWDVGRPADVVLERNAEELALLDALGPLDELDSIGKVDSSGGVSVILRSIEFATSMDFSNLFGDGGTDFAGEGFKFLVARLLLVLSASETESNALLEAEPEEIASAIGSDGTAYEAESAASAESVTEFLYDYPNVRIPVPVRFKVPEDANEFQIVYDFGPGFEPRFAMWDVSDDGNSGQ